MWSHSFNLSLSAIWTQSGKMKNDCGIYQKIPQICRLCYAKSTLNIINTKQKNAHKLNFSQNRIHVEVLWQWLILAVIGLVKQFPTEHSWCKSKVYWGKDLLQPWPVIQSPCHNVFIRMNALSRDDATLPGLVRTSVKFIPQNQKFISVDVLVRIH